MGGREALRRRHIRQAWGPGEETRREEPQVGGSREDSGGLGSGSRRPGPAGPGLGAWGFAAGGLKKGENLLCSLTIGEGGRAGHPHPPAPPSLPCFLLKGPSSRAPRAGFLKSLSLSRAPTHHPLSTHRPPPKNTPFLVRRQERPSLELPGSCPHTVLGACFLPALWLSGWQGRGQAHLRPPGLPLEVPPTAPAQALPSARPSLLLA